MNDCFDVKIFKGRLVILPLRELDSDDFVTVKEVQESNAMYYILQVCGDGEDISTGWDFKQDKNRYSGTFKIRYEYADDLNKRVAELEAENNIKLDMLERVYLDIICKAYGTSTGSTTKTFASLDDFEERTGKINTDIFYKEAVSKTNKDYAFRSKFYKEGLC